MQHPQTLNGDMPVVKVFPHLGGAVFSCHGSSVYLGLPRDCFDEVYAMDKVLLDNEEQKKNSS